MGSVQRLDASRSDSNVTRITEGETAVGELSRARADQIEERLAGADLGVNLRGMEIGGSAIHSRFSSTLVPVSLPTSVTLLAGNELNVGSCYIQGEAGRLSVLGEVAKSNPGGYARQIVLAAKGELLDVSIYSVYAAQNYHSLHSKVWGGFGEDANNQGQTGGRFCVKWPGQVVNVQAWSSQDPFRTSRFPLARDAGGVGIRSDTEFRPTLITGLLVQREWREETELERTSVRQINRARIEATVHSRYEFKVRLEMKTSKGEQAHRSSIGTLLFAQVRGEVRKVSYFVRVTLFNAEDNMVALRAYENSPVGVPSVAVLSGSGRRLALVASRDLGAITGSIKVAHTVSEHPDRETFMDAALQLSCGW